MIGKWNIFIPYKILQGKVTLICILKVHLIYTLTKFLFVVLVDLGARFNSPLKVEK